MSVGLPFLLPVIPKLTNKEILDHHIEAARSLSQSAMSDALIAKKIGLQLKSQTSDIYETIAPYLIDDLDIGNLFLWGSWSTTIFCWVIVGVMVLLLIGTGYSIRMACVLNSKIKAITMVLAFPQYVKGSYHLNILDHHIEFLTITLKLQDL